MRLKADAVIVGGGVIGTSVAFHLAKLGMRDTVLLEQAHLAAGSTGRSVGIIETNYALEVDVALAKAGYDEFSRFADVTGGTADFHRRAYLETVANPAQEGHLERAAEVGRAHGVRVRLVGPDEIRAVFPELCVDDVSRGLLSEDAGFCDPHGVASSYAAAAQRLGVEVATKTAAERLLVDHRQVRGVQTSGGDITAPVVVNATGPWCNDLLAPLGIRLPIARWQRQIFVTSPHPEIPNDRPMYIDLPGRFYFRQELDGGFVLGLVEDDPARDSELANPETDWEFKTRAVAAAIHRVPKLAATSIANAWSGVVTFTPDQLPILGPVQEAAGLYLANGMSGYGVMISPGVGQALAELIAHGESKTIDVSGLTYDRFRGKKVVKGAGLWLSGP
ncbi:MAG TPA: FAD-binding oxidoreductase [Thermoplasmata archaeon]|nr:FAD-binding oxidoreductase [Thermoplasmata archaeon]